MESFEVKAGKPEKLDLNAPLISTRRLGGLAGGDDTARCTHEASVPSPEHASRSVPFQWEAAPGVPKAADSTRDRDEDAFEPPRPPPGRWRPPGEDVGDENNDPRRGDGSDDSGDDGDVDNGSEGEDPSDSAGVASLSNSLSVACSLSRVEGERDVTDAEEGGELGRAPPPSFMLQRFLPAAEAVAASFAAKAFCRNPVRRRVRAPSLHHHPRKKAAIKTGLQRELARRSQTRSYSSSKACGITVFFPWGFKQAFCGFKSSVQSGASFDRRSHGTSRGAHDGDARHSASFGFEVDADGGGAGEAQRARTWDSPGWGLRFLDCRGCEGVAVAARGGGKGPGKGEWSLPPLREPSEPWLAQALRTINKGEHT